MKSENNLVSVFYNISKQAEEPLAALCVSRTVREYFDCSMHKTAIRSSGACLTISGPYWKEPEYSFFSGGEQEIRYYLNDAPY